MNKHQNPSLTAFAQELRRNMTKEEQHLWYDFLKKLPVTVQRQKVIDDYIVDFYCAKAHLVIELDGSQHYDPVKQYSDALRDAKLQKLGLSVLRYSNTDVHLHFQSVCQDIWNHIFTEEQQ